MNFTKEAKKIISLPSSKVDDKAKIGYLLSVMVEHECFVDLALKQIQLKISRKDQVLRESNKLISELFFLLENKKDKESKIATKQIKNFVKKYKNCNF